MPNIKSAIKRVKITEAKTKQNTIIKSAMRTQIKKCKAKIANGEADAGDMSNITKVLDKAVTKGVIHKNAASRMKSRLAKAANAASVANAVNATKTTNA